MKLIRKYYIHTIFVILSVTNMPCFSQESTNELSTPSSDTKIEPKSDSQSSLVKQEPKSEPKAEIIKEENNFHKNTSELKSITKLDHSITNNHNNSASQNHSLNQNDNKKNSSKDNKLDKNDKDIKSTKENKDSKNKKEEDKKLISNTKNSTNINNNLVNSSVQNNKDDNTLSHIKIDNSSNNSLPKDEDVIQDNVISQYGKIIARKELSDNITAWIVEKNSRRVILYTSSNKSIVIHGIAWDTKNKQNINQLFSNYLVTNKLLPTNINSNVTSTKTNINEHADELSNKKFSTPDIIKGLNNIYGVKEGNGNILDTVYIFFDPRCPYCRQAYIKSRSYVSAGKSIKWIPVIILGEDEQAQKNAGNLLQSSTKQQANLLKRTLEDKENFDIKLNSTTLRSLLVNKQSLNILAGKSKMDEIAVPVAFFFDKRTGKTKYLKGIHIPEVMEEIFKGI